MGFAYALGTIDFSERKRCSIPRRETTLQRNVFSDKKLLGKDGKNIVNVEVHGNF